MLPARSMGHIGTLVFFLTHLNWACICGERGCRGYPCSDGSGCISESSVCNGTVECADGSDELETRCTLGVLRCRRGEFECLGGRCVSLAFRCDGTDDCGDASDEAGCDGCARSSLLCKPTGSCVPRAQLCDGILHCPDGSDEVCPSPPAAPHTCPAHMFTCRSGQCVPHTWRCDHTPDCGDSSDEEDCDKNECEDNNGGCSHICADQPMGFVCDCPTGMRLVRDMHCEEIDACLDADVCSQVCAHTNGTVTCECHAGYRKTTRAGECRAGGTEAMLVFSSSVGVQKADTAGLMYRRVMEDALGAGALASLTQNNSLYWWSSAQGAVYRSSLYEPYEAAELVVDGLGDIGGLAVDWLHELLYWSDYRNQSIGVAQLRGPGRRVLIPGLSKPQGVAVEPLLGYLFWTDCGRFASIERAGMDGRDRVAIVTTAVHKPVALSIDMPRRLLYWVDAGLRTISRVGLDGEHRKTVLESNGHLDQPLGLAVFEGRVFWSDAESRSICSVDKHNGRQFRVIASNISSPGGLALVHPLLQPQGPGVCGHSGLACPYQCVPAFFTTDSPRFTCIGPPNGSDGDHNASHPIQHALIFDAASAGIFSLAVLLSMLGVSMMLWWWRGQLSDPRTRLHADMSLKESQDPLVSPVASEATNPAPEVLLKTAED